MENSIGRKIILCLLDCVPKSAQEIADNIVAPLETVEAQLTRLASENICEAVNGDEGNQWAVRKNIDTFAQLLQVFISSDEPSEDEKSQFVTSVLYLKRIDLELVDFVIERFHLDLVYRTDDEKEGLRRLLLVSPSGVSFALHSDTQIFDELRSNQNQLDSSDSTREWLAQIACSQFQTPLLDMLIADMKVTAYGLLYAVLQLRAAKISTHVSLATPGGKYVEAAAGGSFSLAKALEHLRAGQLVAPVNPIAFAQQGLAFFHLGEFQIALGDFEHAIATLQDSTQRAMVWNNKGLVFLKSKQYQKAIECFEEGITLDSEGKLAPLRENKRLAQERLVHAADAHNFNQPTQARFFLDQPVSFEETRLYEFKEVSSRNPVGAIENTADEYAVSFLNREGGRLFWGIRDSDRITVGVTLDDQARNKTRRQVSQKLCQIQPPISVEHWRLEFHVVHDLRGQAIPNLWVIELVVLPPQEKEVFYTGGGEVFVKTEGGKQKLQGPALTEFILNHRENDTD